MYLFFKRLIDIFVSLILISVLSPLFILLILILRFTGEKEVFYKQERVGYKGQTFYILKFATMLKDSLNLGTGAVTLRNDPRITKIGKILRITKINELPQIINVLKGDMTLVGPRPLLVKSFSKYSIEAQEAIKKCVPGITGIGSIMFRDEEKMITNAKVNGIEPKEFYANYVFPYKGSLEIWYSKNKNMLIDVKIVILTALIIVVPKYKNAHKWFYSIPLPAYDTVINNKVPIM